MNVHHIVDVIDNRIYTDDTFPEATDYTYICCVETYEEIKNLIERAME